MNSITLDVIQLCLLRLLQQTSKAIEAQKTIDSKIIADEFISCAVVWWKVENAPEIFSIQDVFWLLAILCDESCVEWLIINSNSQFAIRAERAKEWHSILGSCMSSSELSSCVLPTERHKNSEITHWNKFEKFCAACNLSDPHEWSLADFSKKVIDKNSMWLIGAENANDLCYLSGLNLCLKGKFSAPLEIFTSNSLRSSTKKTSRHCTQHERSMILQEFHTLTKESNHAADPL